MRSARLAVGARAVRSQAAGCFNTHSGVDLNFYRGSWQHAGQLGFFWRIFGWWRGARPVAPGLITRPNMRKKRPDIDEVGVGVGVGVNDVGYSTMFNGYSTPSIAFTPP